MIKSLADIFKLLNSKPASVHSNSVDFSTALDLGRSRLLALEGKIGDGKISLKQIAQFAIGLDFSLSSSLRSLFNEQKFSSENVRFSLKSPNVVTRFLRFPKMSEKELRGVLQYEIEQYVPFEAKDLYLDLAVLQESVKTDQGENTEIFVSVAKKDHLDGLLKQFHEAQVAVDSIDVDILACMKCLKFFHPDEFAAHTAILDLGLNVTTLGIMRHSQPRFIRDLSFGSLDITKKLKSRASLPEEDIQLFLSGKSNVSDDQAAVFNDSIEGLINDVKVSFDYYRDQSEDGVSADCLFVCGLGSSQPHILKMLQQSLDIPVKSLDLISKIELSSQINPELFTALLPDMPVALGLLLRDYD